MRNLLILLSLATSLLFSGCENDQITTSRNNTDRNNLCDMLTVGRYNFISSYIATTPIHTITTKRNTYKTLNHKDIMEIASTLSSASQRNHRFGLVVRGILLQLLNVADGYASAEVSCNLDDNLESIFPKMIERYKNSMKDAKLSKKIDFTSLRPPTKPMDQHMGSKGRIKSTVEKK